MSERVRSVPRARARLRSAAVTVASVLVAAFLLAVLARVAGPTWDPRPVTDHVRSEGPDVTIGPDDPLQTTPEGTYEVAFRDTVIHLDGADVDGRLTVPVGAPPGPAVLFMHGAGTAGAGNFADQARALASAGVTAFVPAKRMDTYSTRERDYEGMARDYLRSFDFLRAQPEVDPDRVGVYAESEGAWIAPIAAAENPDIAFLVLVSAPVVPPRWQGAFAADAYLRNTHVPAPVFRAIPRALGASIPGGGFEYVDFDVRPWQRQVHVPVLMVYGTHDASMPIEQGPRIVQEDLTAAGNVDLTLRYFADANHGIRIDGQLAPGFTAALVRWTQGLPQLAHAQPHVAGAQPHQEYLAAAVPTPRWYATGDLLVWTLLGSIGLVLVGLLLGGVNLLRGSVRWAGRARLGLAFGLSTLAVVAAFGAYLAQVAGLALNYRLNDVVVIGGWIVVNVVGLLAVTMGVLSVRAAVRERRGGVAADGFSTTAWWVTHAGSLALLVCAAYWGVLG